MRIVSGTHKGRVIRAPKNFKLRPTTDLAKESLFNMLANTWELEGLEILDLFAGIGSITLEFASRGAKSVIAIENNTKHARFIDETAESLEIDSVKVLRADVFEFLPRCSGLYNIVFADPPYALEGVEKLPDMVFNQKILKENGEFILEHSDEHSFTDHPFFVQVRKYGAVHFSFFEVRD